MAFRSSSDPQVRGASHSGAAFVSRSIPLVGIAIGLVGCDEEPAIPLSSVVGDTGTVRDTGGRDDLDVGTDSDTGGSTDTDGRRDTEGSDVPSDAVAAVIARFCAAVANCYGDSYPDSIERCEASTAEYMMQYADSGAGCYTAALAYIDALSRGECVIEEYDGYEYTQLRSDDLDLVGFAAACTGATPEEIAIATAYCDTYVSCYGDSYITPDECTAEVLWAAAEYDEALDYYACVAEADCIGGYLNHDCYEY